MVELNFGTCYVAIIYPGMSPGVVSIWSSSVFCFTCQQKHCKHCKHVQIYLNKCEEDEVPDYIYKLLELLNDHPRKKTYIYETLSKNLVEFHLPEHLRQPYLEVNQLKEENIFQMFPDEISIPICDRCHSPWENTCFKQNKDEIPLFCRYEIHKTNGNILYNVGFKFDQRWNINFIL